MIKKFVIALSLGAMALGATACNTVRGAGDDLESAANSVDKATWRAWPAGTKLEIANQTLTLTAPDGHASEWRVVAPAR